MSPNKLVLLKYKDQKLHNIFELVNMRLTNSYIVDAFFKNEYQIFVYSDMSFEKRLSLYSNQDKLGFIITR